MGPRSHRSDGGGGAGVLTKLLGSLMKKRKTTIEFEVHGPYRIPTQKVQRGTRIIGRDDAKSFWTSDPRIEDIADCVGCYVFAVRVGKGFRPAYIGKTVRSFEKEALAHSKRTRYNEYMLRHYKIGTPIMFFLSYPSKGQMSKKRIKELETFLIQLAVSRNDKLINIQGTRTPRWGISGVLRSFRRKPTNAEKKFKDLFGGLLQE